MDFVDGASIQRRIRSIERITGVHRGNGIVNGGMLVANLYDNQGNLLPPTSAPGAPTINWGGGGTATINYDSCWISKMQNRPVYRVMASHEEMY